MAFQIAAWAAGLSLAERVVSLIKSIFRPAPKGPPDPTAPAPTTGPAAAPPAAGRPSYYRPRPKALLGLPGAWLALWWCVGCASTAAFTAGTLEELVKTCESVVPCQPCPPCQTPAPVPTDDGAPIPPAPDPGNPLPPPDDGAVAGVDAIDPAAVTWLHASPAKFGITATLSDVKLSIGTRSLSWAWAHPPWPEWRSDPGAPYVVANLWVLGQINGRWYGSTLEWMRADTVHSALQGGREAPIFVQAKRSPIDKWRPGRGERVCWMVSTITRAGIQPANSPQERSPIVCGVIP